MLTENYLLDVMVSVETIENETYETTINLNFKDKEIPGDKYKRLEFLNCTFKKGVSITNLEMENLVIEFTNCTFQSFRLINSKLADFHFDKCNLNNFSIFHSEIDSVYFTDCQAKKELVLSEVKGGFVSVSNSEISKFRLFCKEMEEVDIISKNTIDTIELNAFKKISITGSVKKIISHLGEFNSLEVEALYDYIDEGDGEKKASIVANRIEELSFRYNSFTGSVKIEDLEIDHLNMNDVDSDKGFMRFNELKIKKAHFSDVAIKSFYWNQVTFKDELRIERCDFSSLKIANVKWLPGKKMSDSFIDEEIPLFYLIRKKWFEKFEKNQKSKGTLFLHSLRKRFFGDLDLYDDQDISDLQYERETYRQLKATSISNQNLMESLDFYRNEMRLHWKEMRINNERNWADRVLVFVNRVVSDFGQNWWWALLWLFAVHFGLMLCLFFGKWEIDVSATHHIGFWGEYFNLLNPVHKTPDYVTTEWGKVTDFVMRIFSSYFIYHFINASRKFGKS